MTAPAKTALLVLLDTATGGREPRSGGMARDVPFGSGIRSSRAELALLLTGTRGWLANLATGRVSALPAHSVASNPSGYANALEARVPRAMLGALPARIAVAAATGIADPGGGPR